MALTEFGSGFSHTLKTSARTIAFSAALGGFLVLGGATFGAVALGTKLTLGVIGYAASIGTAAAAFASIASATVVRPVRAMFKNFPYGGPSQQDSASFKKGTLTASLALVAASAAGFAATQDAIPAAKQQTTERNAIKGIMNARAACESGDAYIEIQKDPNTMKLANATIICQPKQ